MVAYDFQIIISLAFFYFKQIQHYFYQPDIFIYFIVNFTFLKEVKSFNM
jgi:hypothetical protein